MQVGKLQSTENGKYSAESTQFQRQSHTNVGGTEGDSRDLDLGSFTRLNNLCIPSRGGGAQVSAAL